MTDQKNPKNRIEKLRKVSIIKKKKKSKLKKTIAKIKSVKRENCCFCFLVFVLMLCFCFCSRSFCNNVSRHLFCFDVAFNFYCKIVGLISCCLCDCLAFNISFVRIFDWLFLFPKKTVSFFTFLTLFMCVVLYFILLLYLILFKTMTKTFKN